VDLHVPVQRRLAYAAGSPALGIEAVGQVGDRLLEALRDGREVLLVPGDQRRVGLGTEAAGKIKRAGSPGIHGISSDLRSRATSAQQGAWTGGTNPVAMTGSAPPEWTPWPLPVQVARACRLSCSGSWLDDPAWFTRALAAFPATLMSAGSAPGQRLCGITRVLAASPPVRYILKMEGSGYSPPFDCPLWTDSLLAKRRRAAYGGTAGQEDLPRADGCSRGTRSSGGSALARPGLTCGRQVRALRQERALPLVKGQRGCYARRAACQPPLRSDQRWLGRMP